MVRSLAEKEPNRSEVPAADQFIKHQQIEIAEARDAMIVAKHRQTIKAGQRRNPKIKFEVGDRVWLRRNDSERRKKKFEPIWTGPYRILNISTETGNCELDLNSQGGRKRHIYPWVAQERLKEFIGEDHYEDGIEPDIEDPEYEVETIIEHDDVVQPNGEKKRYYRVRWKGYEAEEDTWEPEEHLGNAVELIADYWQGDFANQMFTEAMNIEVEVNMDEDAPAEDEFLED
jgi:hypothetical protein